MRSFTALTILSILSAAVTTFAAPTVVARDGFTEMQAGPTDLSLSIGESVAPTPVKRLTNAERLARGLQPAAPKRRYGNALARDATPSNTPTVTRRGRIQVIAVDGGNVLGYVSSTSFSQAQHRYAPIDSALTVSYTVPVGTTTASQLNLAMENSDMTNVPFIGLVQGRDSTSSDISKGNFNYGYFAGTTQTPAGSTPQHADNSYTTVTKTDRTAESAIWSIDANDVLTVQWLNTDSSATVTQTFAQGTALYFGGDKDSFAGRYPSPVTAFTLKFVAI